MPITLDGSSGMTLPGANTSVQLGSLTLGTAQTASGTAVNFTGIPSWAKRVTVLFRNLSTNGTSLVQIQLGAGTITTSGYNSTASFGTSNTNQYAYLTTGFVMNSPSGVTAALTISGSYVFSLLDSNTWVGNGNQGGDPGALVTWACAGSSPGLGGSLDRIRITTVNGTDIFDAGTVNIMYE